MTLTYFIGDTMPDIRGQARFARITIPSGLVVARFYLKSCDGEKIIDGRFATIGNIDANKFDYVVPVYPGDMTIPCKNACPYMVVEFSNGEIITLPCNEHIKILERGSTCRGY